MLSKSAGVALSFVVAVCILLAYSKMDAQAQDPTHKTGLPVVQDASATDDTPSLSHFDTDIGAQSSGAAIVYTQPPNGALLQQQSSQLGYGQYGSDYDQYVWDNFTLNSTRAITEIVWRGVYNSGGSVGGAVIDFTVGVYTSTAGNTQPDHLNGLLVQYTLGGTAGETPPWTPSGMSASIHDYAFTLPVPFTATAGIKYWVQIEGIQNGLPDWGIVAGTGGNGLHFYAIAGVGDFYFNIASGDAAFTLLGPPVPIAGLSATNDGPTVLGRATTFTATVSAGSDVSYAWNFGDQTTGSGQIVTHTYPHAGLFTATVTATNSVSGPVTATTRITVTEAPITGLSATNDGPTLLGGITTLEASVASGSNVAYTWNSGDGHIRSGRVITHIYPATGSFTAIVTASNSASGPFTATTVVSVTGAEIPVSGLVAANNSPTLWGSVTTLTASVASGSSVVYTWSLGDGQVGNGRVVTHPYPLGVYTAVVTASNSVNTLTASTVVTVTAPQHVYLPLTLKGVGSVRGATRQSH